MIAIAFAHGLVLGAFLASAYFILGRLSKNSPK